MNNICLIFFSLLITSTIHGLNPFVPDIKETSLPLIESTDKSLSVAIEKAVMELSGGGEYRWPGLIICFPDSVPPEKPVTATLYEGYENMDFLRIYEGYSDVSKNFIGRYSFKYRDKNINVFVAGSVAKKFFRQKGDEIVTYTYDANFIIIAETKKIEIRRTKGRWSVVPGSLQWQ